MAGSLAAHVYRLYHTPRRFGVRSMNANAMQLLLTAAHIEVLESVVLPALANGKTVVLDRYWWSTIVYGLEDRVPEPFLDALLALERLTWRRTLPSALFLITRAKGLSSRNTERTKRLRLLRRYRALAHRESATARYPIHVISNNGKIQDTITSIASLIKNVRLRSKSRRAMTA